MDIIFGGLLVFGLQGFAKQFDSWPKQSTAEVTSVVFAAIGVTAFFVYDVTVHHVLTSPTWFPFRRSWRSAVRFALDVAMAFTLALVLLPGLEGSPWMATDRILIAVSAWHVGALLWHWIARSENPTGKGAWSWHIGAIAFYWLALIVASELSGYRAPSLFDSFKRPLCLDVLSLALLAFAVVRTSDLLGLRAVSRNEPVGG